jgi:hypothetical protein
MTEVGPRIIALHRIKHASTRTVLIEIVLREDPAALALALPTRRTAQALADEQTKAPAIRRGFPFPHSSTFPRASHPLKEKRL